MYICYHEVLSNQQTHPMKNYLQVHHYRQEKSYVSFFVPFPPYICPYKLVPFHFKRHHLVVGILFFLMFKIIFKTYSMSIRQLEIITPSKRMGIIFHKQMVCLICSESCFWMIYFLKISFLIKISTYRIVIVDTSCPNPFSSRS